MWVKLLKKYAPPVLIFLLIGSCLLVGARWISTGNEVSVASIVSDNTSSQGPVNSSIQKIYEDNDPYDVDDDIYSGNYYNGRYNYHDNTSARFPQISENEFYDKIRIEEGRANLTDQLIAEIAFKIIYNLKIIGGTLYWNYKWEDEGDTLLYTFKWVSSGNVAYIKSYRVHLEQNNV